jgi:ubiquinone/menaquinone biosynthesis C-methylase UbiE
MTRNAQQIEFWNGKTGQRWAEEYEDTDANLAAISSALMAFANPKPGERVLDIGCGCGTTTLILDQAVGRAGKALGIDVSVPMLDVAQARAREGKTFAQFSKADAATHPFKPEFDLLFSRFGVMFFDDPEAAFANIHRAGRKSGRLAFVCWRSFAENEWAFAPYSAAKPFLPPAEATNPEAPGPFAFADAGRIKAILTRAGFASIVIEKLDSTMNLGASVEIATKQAMSMGPLSRALLEAGDAPRAKVREAVSRRIKDFATSEGVKPKAGCWLVGAKI